MSREAIRAAQESAEIPPFDIYPPQLMRRFEEVEFLDEDDEGAEPVYKSPPEVTLYYKLRHQYLCNIHSLPFSTESTTFESDERELIGFLNNTKATSPNIPFTQSQLEDLQSILLPRVLEKYLLFEDEEKLLYRASDHREGLKQFVIDNNPDVNYEDIIEASYEYLETIYKLALVNQTELSNASVYSLIALEMNTRLGRLFEEIYHLPFSSIMLQLKDEEDITCLIATESLKRVIERQSSVLNEVYSESQVMEEIYQSSVKPYFNTDQITHSETEKIGDIYLPKLAISLRGLSLSLRNKLATFIDDLDEYDTALIKDDSHFGSYTQSVLARYFGLRLTDEIEGVSIAAIAYEIQDILHEQSHPFTTISANHSNLRTARIDILNRNPDDEFISTDFPVHQLWDRILGKTIHNNRYISHLFVTWYKNQRSSKRYLGTGIVHSISPQNIVSDLVAITQPDHSLAIGSIVGTETIRSSGFDYSPDTLKNPRAILNLDFVCPPSDENRLKIIEGIGIIAGNENPSWALIQSDKSYHAVIIQLHPLEEVPQKWIHIVDTFVCQSVHPYAQEQGRKIKSSIQQAIYEEDYDKQQYLYKRIVVPLLAHTAHDLKMNPTIREDIAIDLGHLAFYISEYVDYLKGDKKNTGYLRVSARPYKDTPRVIAVSKRAGEILDINNKNN